MSFSTEAGQLTYTTPDVLYSAGFRNHGPVLEGTAICAESCTPTVNGLPEGVHVACSASPGVYGLLDCFDQAIEGGVEDEAGCLVPLDGSSSIEVRYTPSSCALVDEVPEVVLEPDVLSIAVVPASSVTASFEPWPEEGAADLFDVGLLRSVDGGGAFPTDWMFRPGEPMRVVDGGRVTFFVQLLHVETGRKVGRGAEVGEIEVSGGREVELGPPGFVTLTASESEPAEVRLRVGGAVWTAASVIGVSEATVDSLEIVGAQHRLPSGEPVEPLGARAVVRDSEGELVFGAPVTWRVERGSAALVGPDEQERGLRLPGKDYVFIRDHCLPPSKLVGAREVSLSASYLHLRDEVSFAWTGRTDLTRAELESADARFEPAPQCPTSDTGCACGLVSGGPVHDGTGVVLACAVAVLIVRRRSRSA